MAEKSQLQSQELQNSDEKSNNEVAEVMGNSEEDDEHYEIESGQMMPQHQYTEEVDERQASERQSPVQEDDGMIDQYLLPGANDSANE